MFDFRSRELEPKFERIERLTFEACVPDDIFGIFRKGPEWDEGTEHAVILRSGSREERDALDDALARLQENAHTFQQLTCGSDVRDEGTVGLLLRFSDPLQYKYFLGEPDYAALFHGNGSAVEDVVTYAVGSQASRSNRF